MADEICKEIVMPKEDLLKILNSLSLTADFIANKTDVEKIKMVKLLYKYFSARMFSNSYAARVVQFKFEDNYLRVGDFLEAFEPFVPEFNNFNLESNIHLYMTNYFEKLGDEAETQLIKMFEVLMRYYSRESLHDAVC